jgi:hypothetical protein
MRVIIPKVVAFPAEMGTLANVRWRSLVVLGLAVLSAGPADAKPIPHEPEVYRTSTTHHGLDDDEDDDDDLFEGSSSAERSSGKSNARDDPKVRASAGGRAAGFQPNDKLVSGSVGYFSSQGIQLLSLTAAFDWMVVDGRNSIGLAVGLQSAQGYSSSVLRPSYRRWGNTSAQFPVYFEAGLLLGSGVSLPYVGGGGLAWVGSSGGIRPEAGLVFDLGSGDIALQSAISIFLVI